MVCFGKNVVVSSTVKKKPKTMLFGTTLWVLLLPLDVQRQGKKNCAPLHLLLSLFLPKPKKLTKKPPTCLKYDPWPTIRQKKKTEGTSPSGGPEVAT
jgi:hypothetical protein